MQTKFLRVAALVVGALLAGCSDQLAVTNPNVVDVDAAFKTVGGIKQVIGKSYQGLFQGQYANLNALIPQTMNLSGESSASVANAGMGLRTGIPRQLIDNQLGNQTFDGNFRDFSFFTRFARQGANGIKALRTLNQSDVSTAQTRALGFFVIGYAQGHIAMMYDSAAVIRPDTVDETKLSSAAEVSANAILMLDSAVAITNAFAAVPGGFPTLGGSDLIAGSTISAARFVQIVRSYRAKFRAGVARTPAERAAVDWAAVEADAAAGVTTDLTVALDGAVGWSIAGTIGQLAVFGGWHQMPLLFAGMADTTGRYNSYIAVGTFASARTGFLMETPDSRWPKGATRAAQQAFQPATVPATGVYFRNRPSGEDVSDNGNPWANSNYDHFRWRPINDANNVGTWTLLSFREISMLRAEALIRLNRVADAIPLINASRTLNNLPAIPLTATLTTPVPGGTTAAPVIGGSSCVPRVPVSATTTACGNVLEAMKWEKRMESAFTGYAQWFLDSRGWGDLVPGTPLEWPVPIQEMNSRSKPFYNGQRFQAATNTYFFTAQ
jgi:hypothetical protein